MAIASDYFLNVLFAENIFAFFRKILHCLFRRAVMTGSPGKSIPAKSKTNKDGYK
jgi:hypothetical protein